MGWLWAVVHRVCCCGITLAEGLAGISTPMLPTRTAAAAVLQLAHLTAGSMSFPIISSIKSNSAQVRHAGAASCCRFLNAALSVDLPCHSACRLPSLALMVQEHEQGSVQGALYGARPLASGTGPLLFAGLYSALTEPSRRCPSSLGSLPCWARC